MLCGPVGWRMPSEIMDQRQRSPLCMASVPSPLFSDKIGLLTERQVEFWKLESLPDYHGIKEMPMVPRSKSFAPPPMEKSRVIGFNSLESLQPFSSIKDQKSKLGIDHHFMGGERIVSLSTARWKTTEQDSGPQSNLHARPASLYVDGNKNMFQYKNAFSSSSLSGVVNRELTLSSRDALCAPSVDTVNSTFEEDEHFESLDEIEVQTVGSLLPDEDELLSGIIDDLEHNFRPNRSGDAEYDLFCSGGGMELEADDSLINNKGLDPANGVSIYHHEMLNNPFSGEHPYVEHPSRTLFVWNINNEVEDYELKALFEQYGDIHTLYTAFKCHGFVMISYYDIRSACNAMKALQSKPLRHRKLDIHFSILKQDNPSEKDINQGTLTVFNLDSSVSNDDLCQIFGDYGDIKQIHETPHGHHHKFIEFYDVRAAEAALCALNRSDIAGKQIKVEPAGSGVAGQCSMMQESSDFGQEEANGCCQQGSPSNSSPLGEFGSINHGVITSYGYDNGPSQGVHTVHAPCCPIINSKFGGISSNIPHSLSYPVRVASAGNHSNQSELIELSHSVGEMKSGFGYMPTPYSHSLPEYHDGVVNGIPLNSPSAISSMTINRNSRHAQADNMHIYRAGLCQADSLSYDYNGAFGTKGNGSCPLHGQQYVWSNSDSHHNHLHGQRIWSDSPLFNNISASPAQFHGRLPRRPSHMLNTVPPLHHHHVGSTSPANPSLWDRRHAYAADVTNASKSHPGSLGSTGFSGCCTLSHLELASPNTFPHIGGNIIDPSISPHVGLPSPQQRCHMFHGMTSMLPVPASFDVNDRVRSRRSVANSNQTDNKKQYELDIERIIRGEDSRTTLMIKNIPNKYTSKMLLAAIDECHRGTYDFIYLPIDFKNKCNVGYAFINMIGPQQIIPFFKSFNGKKWEKFNSEKVVSLAYARIQGKAALIAHFQNSSLMSEDKRCRPILFHTDGPNAGDQEPFPMGVNIRSRPGRPRTTGNEDNHQQSPSTSAYGEESSSGTDSSSGSVKDSRLRQTTPSALTLDGDLQLELI